MPTRISKTVPTLDARSEQIVAQFERARARDQAEDPIEFVRSALESVEANSRPALVTELARIELERNFVRDYLHETDWKPSQLFTAFGEWLTNDRARSELAFEHYRLARMHGRSVTRQAIGSLYGVPGDQWKELPLGSSHVSPATKQVEFPRVGETFCGYPLIAELGRGSLARVYLARQTDLASRLIVLKISCRFNAEAEKLARLQHTNIVPVYSVHRSSKDNALYAICMPYLGSLTLADLLLLFEDRSHARIDELISTLVARRRSTLIGTTQSSTSANANVLPSSTPSNQVSSVDSFTNALPQAIVPTTLSRLEGQLGYDELMGALHDLVQRPNDIQSACRLMEGITSGIAYAHSIGIVHRDLKPENVLIANDGRPVVLDFNLSEEPSHGMADMVGGTLPYMSLQHLQSLDRKYHCSTADDVFSIGTIFYRLLTGRLPYANRSIDQLVQLMEERRSPPVNVRKLAGRVPPSLASIVMKCLSPSEEARYPSAVELLEDLVCYRENRALRHAPDHSLVERGQRLVRRHPVLTSTGFLSALGSIVIVIIGLGWWWTTQHAQQLSRHLQFESLKDDMPALLAQLHGPQRDMPQLQQGLVKAEELLHTWGVGESTGPITVQFDGLSKEEREQALQQLGALAYAMASAEGNLFLFRAGPDNQQHRQAALSWNHISQSLAPELVPACRFQRKQLGEPASRDTEDRESGDEAESALARMLLARESHDLTTWLDAAEMMASEQPHDATAWFNLGSAHYTAGHFERAWSGFDVAVKLQPNSMNSIFWRGVTAHQLGRYKQAKVGFEQCLAVDPHWISARHNRALAAFALQQFDDALADVNKLIDSGQAGPRVWLLRARIRVLRHQDELAQQDRVAALSASCQAADDCVAVGVQQIESDPEAALSAFRRAQQVEPTNIGAWLNAAHVLSEKLQQPDEAILAMNRLIALRPNDASHFAARGVLAARLKREAQAREDAEQVSKLSPQPIEKLQVADIYALLSQHSDAQHRSSDIQQSLQWLRQALLDRPQLVGLAEQDADLIGIREQTVFKQLIESAHGLNKLN